MYAHLNRKDMVATCQEHMPQQPVLKCPLILLSGLNWPRLWAIVVGGVGCDGMCCAEICDLESAKLARDAWAGTVPFTPMLGRCPQTPLDGCPKLYIHFPRRRVTGMENSC